MRFALVAAGVFSLLAVGLSAPLTNCQSLTQQIDIPGGDQLLGKWMFIAESTSIPGAKLLTKAFVETIWVTITAANESNAINVVQVQKMFNRCFSLTSKMTLENNSLTIVHPFASTAITLSTVCPDCLVFLSHYAIGDNVHKSVQLLSRRQKLSAAELEEFKKQVECLNLSSPLIFNPEKGFCPEELNSDTIDLTDTVRDLGSELSTIFAKFVNSEGGMEMLLSMISGGISR